MIASTAETLADEHDVSPRSVERAGQFAEAVNAIGEQNPAAKDAILAGKSDVTKSEVIAARNPRKLYCKTCRDGEPIRGCKMCRSTRIRSAGQKSAAAKNKTAKLAERLVPQLRDLFNAGKITPRLLPNMEALDRNQQTVVSELIGKGIPANKAISRALGPGREPGDELPAKRAAKNGQPAIKWKEIEDAVGLAYKQVDRVRQVYGLKNAPDSEKLETDLTDWKSRLKEWFQRVTKPPGKVGA